MTLRFVPWVAGVMLAAMVCAGCGGNASSGITASVQSVNALGGNEVRVYITYTNNGTSPTTPSCNLTTQVYNQYGDNVNQEDNFSSSNGTVQPGQSQTVYQDIGVNNGDAPYVTASDVSISDC